METRTFEYKIVYSRRRSIAISVSPDSGVVVRAPLRASKKTIEGFVNSKSEWILKHLEKHSILTRINNKKYFDGELLLLNGQPYTLKIIPADKNTIEITGSTISAMLKDYADVGKTKVIIDKWIRRKAEDEFAPKFNDLLLKFSHYQFPPVEFSVRTMKRRWGSCTVKGKITINSELIKLEDKFTEYVMLHELCHLKHPNHSSAYYKLLSEVFPAWKSIRKELRQYTG
jgi:predicted metal-dependent hydrolase